MLLSFSVPCLDVNENVGTVSETISSPAETSSAPSLLQANQTTVLMPPPQSPRSTPRRINVPKNSKGTKRSGKGSVSSRSRSESNSHSQRLGKILVKQSVLVWVSCMSTLILNALVLFSVSVMTIDLTINMLCIWPTFFRKKKPPAARLKKQIRSALLFFARVCASRLCLRKNVGQMDEF